MKDIQAHATSIAWFKLAECVGRGEKERALSLYRLLMHSHEDSNEAFMKQLEADLLLGFDTQEALKEYVTAAHWYIRDEQFQEAAFVYQRLIQLAPERVEYFEKMILLCETLNWKSRSEWYKGRLCSLWVIKGNLAKAVTLWEEVEKVLDEVDKLSFYCDFVLSALTHKYANEKVITSYLKKAIDGLLRFGSDKEIQQFLADIKALNAMWHKDAVEYFEKN